MKKQIIGYIVILLSSVVTSTFFTNCADQESYDSASAGTAIDDNASFDLPGNTDIPSNTDLPQGQVGFSEGEVISKAKLALINSRLDAFFDNYFNANPNLPKAIAITYDYQGVFGFYNYSINSEASAEEYAISVCNARYQKKCVILVGGNMFKISSKQLAVIRNQNGSSGRETQARPGQPFTESNFSFLRGSEFVRNYINNTRFKAMALSWNGHLYALASQEDQSRTSRATLEYCQIQSQYRCVLIAEGNTYVWDYMRHQLNWTLPKAGDSISAGATYLPSVPRRLNRDAFQNRYLATVMNGGKGMIMIVPGKQVFARTTPAGSTETREQMIANLQNSCREQYPENGRDKCLLFAENLEVIWNLQDRTNP